MDLMVADNIGGKPYILSLMLTMFPPQRPARRRRSATAENGKRSGER
jgi:hypothetical protein